MQYAIFSPRWKPDKLIPRLLPYDYRAVLFGVVSIVVAKDAGLVESIGESAAGWDIADTVKTGQIRNTAG